MALRKDYAQNVISLHGRPMALVRSQSAVKPRPQTDLQVCVPLLDFAQCPCGSVRRNPAKARVRLLLSAHRDCCIHGMLYNSVIVVSFPCGTHTCKRIRRQSLEFQCTFDLSLGLLLHTKVVPAQGSYVIILEFKEK